MNDATITFRHKDYRDGDKVKIMVLEQEEFVRRFEQHILPKCFVKNYNKTARLNAIRKSMNLPPAAAKVRIPVQQRLLEKYGKDITICPECECGKMVLKETFRPVYKYRITLLPQNKNTEQENHSPSTKAVKVEAAH